jgi:putative transposase
MGHEWAIFITFRRNVQHALEGPTRVDPLRNGPTASFTQTGDIVDTSQAGTEDTVPWIECNVVEQRMRFVIEWERAETSMAALCRAFQISRPTGYKWIARAELDDDRVMMMSNRSRAPLSRPQTTEARIEDLIVRARKLRPQYGPRKLRVWLTELGHKRLPAASTMGDILKRNGLSRPRKFRRRAPPSTQPFAKCTEPNAVWCVDFKGHFRTRDGTRVYPLTIMDAHTRFLLRCEGLTKPDAKHAQVVFESAFREFGVPAAIRSDNGPPFASVGVGGLSPLSVWWIRLGIIPERIEPGKPQQNGRHERMHLTLKQHTASPPAADLVTQQRDFDRFRKLYNEERPHEAIGQIPPARVYHSSSRVFVEPTRHDDSIEADVDQAFVENDGCIAIGRRRFFIGTSLAYQFVQLHPAGERSWSVSFGPIHLGLLDETRKQNDLIRPKPTRDRRKKKVTTMSPV